MNDSNHLGNAGIDEWFVVALARTIGPAETVFHGFGSPCAQVAMHVARRTHAPSMNLIEGAMYAINPVPEFIPPTSNDAALKQGALYSLRFEEFFDAACRGDIDRMFLSGGQIDVFGNTNVTGLGPRERPKVKLGGGGGGCNISATIGRLTLWTTRHRSGRTLVEACDFITDIGHRTSEGDRKQLGYCGSGPELLVTEMGIFDFPEGRARLTHRFPDVTVEEIASSTRWPLETTESVAVIAAPTAAELAAVRIVDPLRIRRSEFAPSELERDLVRPREEISG